LERAAEAGVDEMGALGLEKDYRFHVPLMSQLMNGARRTRCRVIMEIR
jgi:hypothetical protein